MELGDGTGDAILDTFKIIFELNRGTGSLSLLKSSQSIIIIYFLQYDDLNDFLNRNI